MGPLATRTGVSIDEMLGEPTLSSAFLRVAGAAPERVALREFGSERSLTLGEWAARARLVAGGLEALGVVHGDRVALLLTTRLEFHVVDMGAVLLGAVPFSLYVTSPVEQLVPCIENALPRVLVTEAALAETARGLAAACPVIERVVVIDEPRGDELSLEQLTALCAEDFDVHAAVARVRPDDLCSLLYTSGTSGPPKGVQYLHRSLMVTMASIHERVPVSAEGRTLSYLPMAHIAERLFGHYAAFVFGYSVTALGDLTRLGEGLREVRPTRFFGVPRIWEKLLAGVQRAADEPTRAAWERSLERVRAEQAGEDPGRELDAEDAERLNALPRMVGLDCAEWACVAGAPAGRDTIEAWHAIGVRVNELYGMSETIMTSMCPPDRIRIGTAGTPLPGVEIKLADDGEILIGGATVMPGYFRDPGRTREALGDDGWMRSGDIGVIDDDGYLRIVDRKKALIISSSGKNMSPASIEQAIKGGVPLIAQVVVFGDSRPYNVALIVLDRDGLAALCTAQGIPEAPFAERARDARVLAAVDAAVRAGNARLARFEQIKRHAVLDHEWLPASETLTPTAKLKRGQIEARYRDLVEGLYTP
jgi:long-chain acyl-CoA synthetase